MPDPENKEEITPGGEKAMEILKEIHDKLSKPAEEKKDTPESQPKVPDVQAVRTEHMKKMGWNEEQMRLNEEAIASAQAPLTQELAWTKLERSHKDVGEYEKGIREELKNYPASRITPELLDKIYYMVKGVTIDKRDSQPKGHKSGAPSERIARGYNPSENGMSSSGGGGSDKEVPELTEDERFVSSRLGVKPEDYAEAKKARTIRKFARPVEISRDAGPADRELGNLLGKSGGR